MRKEIAAIKAKMDKKFGFNAVRSASEIEEAMFRIPSGSISLDIALGGGIPGGMMTHICGDYSAGKSALAYHIIANAQKLKKKKVIWDKYSTKDKQVYKWEVNAEEGEELMAALIQYESHSYANDWAEQIGVNVEDLIFATPDGLEEGLDIAADLQREAGVGIVVIDSYAAAIATKAMEAESRDTYQMGIKPLKLQDYHGKYQASNNKASRTGEIPCTLIALNQLRSKINSYGGNPDTAPGGRSKDFTASVEIFLRKGDYITIGTGDNKQIIGQVVKFKVNKNKTYAPFKTGSYDFYFDEGGTVPPGNVDNAKELIVEAIVYGIVERRGAWFYYNGNQIGQGVEKAIEEIRNNEPLFEEIKNKVIKVAFESEIEREDVYESDEIVDGFDVIDGVAPIKEEKPKKVKKGAR